MWHVAVYNESHRIIAAFSFDSRERADEVASKYLNLEGVESVHVQPDWED